jgi:uncharacterized protein involved in response to NO
MMTRTAKGHTGRALRAERSDTAAYVLVMVAAGVRVFGPLAAPAAYGAWMVASALCFSTAFTLYTVCYWKPLTQARLDGKPG